MSAANTESFGRSGMRSLVAVVTIGLVVGTVAVWAQPHSKQQPGPDPKQAASVPDAPADAVLFREVFSVNDAVLNDDVWYVLDRMGDQVHRLGLSGEHLGSFGRKGEGPGEFRSPTVVTIHHDTIVVGDGRTLHLFDEAGTPLADRTVELDMSCEIIDAVSAWPSLLLLTLCMDPLDRKMVTRAVLEEEDGSVRVVDTRSVPMGDPLSAHFVLGEHPRGFVFGSPYDPCLKLFGPAGDELDQVCHDWIEWVPVPEPTEEQAEKLAALRERGRGLGIQLNIPEHMPRFDRVFTTVGDRLTYLSPLPDDAGQKLVTQAEDGGATMIHQPAPILFAHGASVLAAWDEREGMRIHFHTLEQSR